MQILIPCPIPKCGLNTPSLGSHKPLSSVEVITPYLHFSFDCIAYQTPSFLRAGDSSAGPNTKECLRGCLQNGGFSGMCSAFKYTLGRLSLISFAFVFFFCYFYYCFHHQIPALHMTVPKGGEEKGGREKISMNCSFQLVIII